ncbi:MAG: WecB/TagA/CpsF family glycosyltransferase, partial [Clostridiales bacterium]
MKILGIRIDEVDMVQVLCCIQEYINLGKPHHIITLNAEILYNARNDLALKEILSNASLVTPDGSGILWAANKLGQPLPERVTGIDLMKEICHQAYCNNWRLYLLGGAP